ncbi:MAG: hypothetical protein WB511_01540 [Nitrososphaeraceae archaeon]
MVNQSTSQVAFIISKTKELTHFPFIVMALKKYQFSQAQFVEKLTSYSFICNLSATKSASSRIVYDRYNRMGYENIEVSRFR